MIARPYLIGMVVFFLSILAIFFLANGVTPEPETVVDVLDLGKR